ncbi:hypothetical protein D3C72_2180490 [compost metagenome]
MDDHEAVEAIDLTLDLLRQALPIGNLHVRGVDVVKHPDLDVREIPSLRNKVEKLLGEIPGPQLPVQGGHAQGSAGVQQE